MSLPSVGDVVHYRSFGTKNGEFLPECRAAIVVEKPEESGDAQLCILNPNGIYFNLCRYDPTLIAGGTWHYTEGCED